MKEQNEEKNLEIGDVISKSELFIEKNQKTIIIVVAAIFVVVLAVFGLRKWYFQPRQVEAAEMMFVAENLFDNGDFQTALDGTPEAMGFAEVAKTYGCTKPGKLAKYYAGMCQLRLGNYNEAIKYFKSYKGKDTFTAIQATIQTGDAYAELGDNDNAVKCYQKAVKMDKENYLTAPNALLKEGILLITMGNNDKANECFSTIKKEYPRSPEAAEADKYAAYAGNLE